MTQHMLAGRAVELRVVSFGVLMQARKIIGRDDTQAEEASTLVLIHSAYWADTGERIFRSVEDLNNNWTAADAGEIMHLIGEAAVLNRPKMPTPTDENGAPQPATNGADVPVSVPLA